MKSSTCRATSGAAVQRKVLAHPAFAPFIREVARVREEMQAALNASFDAWIAEVEQLKSELREAKIELERLRALTAVRPTDTTVH